MRRALVAIGCALVALASCRAVVGVEPLELVDAAAAGADAASGHDGGDASPGGDSGRTDTCTAGSQCRGCCREAYPTAFNDVLPRLLVQTSCVCGSGLCAQECATATCASPPTAPVPPCGPCTDQAVTSPSPTPACANAIAQCRQNPDCAPALNCMQSCP